MNENDGIISIEDNTTKNTIVISYDEWMDIWSIIRNYGFITEKIIPYDYNIFYDEIITLLLKLSYCEEVIINKNYTELNKKSIGVQLNELKVPESQTKQFEMQF